MDKTEYLAFLDHFNAAISALHCGVRVSAVAGSTELMEIVDLDGAPIGQIPTRIEPEVFVAFMAIVEQSFEEGFRTASEKERAPLPH